MRKNFTSPLSILALSCSVLLLTIAACSHAPQAPPKKVELTANDSIKFNITAFEVEHGQKVTVTLTNVGKSPKVSMGHNFILIDKSTNWKKIDEDGSTEASHDYIPEKDKNQIIAHTKLLGPGESDSVTFTAPYVAGDYTFICSFPGHAAQGMRGTMTVK